MDSRQARDFGPEDIELLRTYATVLGPVIDRLYKIRDLQVALDSNQHLLTGLQHRVKNHFGIINGLVLLRQREAKGEGARQELAAIDARIDTLRLMRELLYVGKRANRLHLRPYIAQLIESLCKLNGGQPNAIRLDLAVEDVRLASDLAVPLGLILNEFVTNS